MKEIIKTGLPANVPISQAVRAGELIFVSGQVPVDPDTNEFVNGDITCQTKIVLERIERILEAAGSSLKDVVKVTVFLTNINDFAEMNQVFKEYFPVDPPARSCFEIKLAIDAKVEIEAIAYAPKK
ncbi:MAG: RidA family protein [Bacteroidota bacterium]